ncbi:hypothetical protein [Massilia antarctica]|uniref:hypothetical protein n=1 Tax=Massilia antarctica TaxID=2765360 RepID=UPI002270A2EA|nr:hypothetical protein [Massilia sp. H27-R4]MCY0910851.1 hypothetical protein [Massilia sp. H27-R4]
MEYGSFAVSKWTMFSELQSKLDRIARTTAQVMEMFANISPQDTLLKEVPLSLVISKEDACQYLRTPFGDCRVRTGWRTSSAELEGQIIFERNAVDATGNMMWEAIWGLNIPLYGDPYSGSGPRAVAIPLGHPDKGASEAAIFAALMSILYGIVNGPLLDTL